MINYDNYAKKKKNIIKHNLNWPEIPDLPS